MTFDVGIRENKQKAAYFRVHNSMLSKFVLEEQLKGFLVFSVIPLIPLFKKKEVDKKELIDLGE